LTYKNKLLLKIKLQFTSKICGMMR